MNMSSQILMPSDYSRLRGPETDYFQLFDFSAKYDPVPTMLTQCHTNIIPGFLGQTTSFFKDKVKRVLLFWLKFGTE